MELVIPFSCPKKLECLFDTQYMFNIAYGGRGSGKTETMGQVTIKNSFLGSGHLLITRHTEKAIDASTKSTIETWIKRLGLDEFFSIRNTYIKNLVSHSDMVFTGLSLKTMDNITSIDNVFFSWIDEGHTIPKEAWQRFYPSIRGKFENGDFAKIFITFNPHKEDDTFWKWFIANQRDDSLVIKINYDENEFFKGSSLEKQLESDLKYMPKSYVNHIWKGELQKYNEEPVIDITKFSRFDDSLEYDYDYIALSLDTAYSIKESADYSVIIIAAGVTNKEELHILSIRRGRWDFFELLENLKVAVEWVEKKYSKSPDRILIEDKASGQSLIQEMNRLTTYFISKVKPIGDKYSRVCEVLPFIHKGGVRLPMTNDAMNVWIKSFLLELDLFRADMKHDHDDQIDALTQLIRDYHNKAPIDWNSW